jgi:hypothetical protein
MFNTILMCCLFALAFQSVQAQLTERQRAILNGVRAVGGTIDKKTHAEFWAELTPTQKQDPKTAALLRFGLESLILADVYQRELWRAALLSLRTSRVVKTSELEFAREQYFSKSLMEVPLDKASNDYTAFKKSFLAEASIGVKRGDEMLAAAAEQGRYKTFQGVTVVIDETYVATILAGLQESMKRMQRLVSPTWHEDISETR